jgi:hypothetical protein
MYVIIGATGHTGSAAANKLLKQGKKCELWAGMPNIWRPWQQGARNRLSVV